MEHAVAFAETGHLCLATLHANSSNQALDRIINFFPEERRQQLLMDLSLNLKALVSQRLMPREQGRGRVAAVEIMLNTPLVGDMIFKGEVNEIKELMKRSARARHADLRPEPVRPLRRRARSATKTRCATPTRVNDLRLQIKLQQPARAQHRPGRRHRKHEAGLTAAAAAAAEAGALHGSMRGHEHPHLRTDDRRAAWPSWAWA